jgi:hypothetical protein
MPINKIICIYRIVQSNNDAMSYIGSTIDFKRRMYDHNYRYKSGRYNHVKLYKYISENNGINNFRFEILKQFDECTKFELTTFEFDYIQQYKSNLNKNRPAKTPTICEHNRKGNQCRQCGGLAFCIHDHPKNICRLCSPVAYAKKLEYQRRYRLNKSIV